MTYQNRGVIPAPRSSRVSGNSIISSTPLDNHLAVGPQEHVVSTINVHMLVTNTVDYGLVRISWMIFLLPQAD